MYIGRSLAEGLQILSFNKQVIRKISRERNLEEIFLTTLFVNYLIVMVFYLASFISGGFFLEGRVLNPHFVYAILMVYPFAFNLFVYVLYGVFSLMAELLDKKLRFRPLLSVGFHTAVVYALFFYAIVLVSTFSLSAGLFLFLLLFLYFLYSLFLSLSVVYSFSLPQTLIVLFVPFVVLGFLFLLLFLFFPSEIFSFFSSFYL
ncbi:hypothetical protein H6501_02690 [Candidatus Woesearchaeota archaeon]|nr:hypothetical protein [Nanoarchaeota archaeon]MCB9370478.1 hypothetical protein [Candidatus Woesearchaeota archaeon]USN43556.1 MAG: hypothetical protein H6500_04135 [Candidatus Woesearchaeota archaeon]